MNRSLDKVFVRPSAIFSSVGKYSKATFASCRSFLDAMSLIRICSILALILGLFFCGARADWPCQSGNKNYEIRRCIGRRIPDQQDLGVFGVRYSVSLD